MRCRVQQEPLTRGRAKPHACAAYVRGGRLPADRFTGEAFGAGFGLPFARRSRSRRRWFRSICRTTSDSLGLAKGNWGPRPNEDGMLYTGPGEDTLPLMGRLRPEEPKENPWPLR